MASSTTKIPPSSSLTPNHSNSNSHIPENPNSIPSSIPDIHLHPVTHIPAASPNSSPAKPNPAIGNLNSSSKNVIHADPKHPISTSKALIPFTPNTLLVKSKSIPDPNPNPDHETTKMKSPNSNDGTTNSIQSPSPSPNPKPDSNTRANSNSILKPNSRPEVSSPDPNSATNSKPNPNPRTDTNLNTNPDTNSSPNPHTGPINDVPKRPEHKKRSKNWSRSETLTLIRARAELAARFAKSGRKSELWDEIAESLRRGHFARDAQQCHDKWEKLLASYKEVRDGLKAPEDSPYYEELHPLLVLANSLHNNTHRKRDKSDESLPPSCSAAPLSTLLSPSATSQKNALQGLSKTTLGHAMAPSEPSHSLLHTSPHPHHHPYGAHHTNPYHHIKPAQSLQTHGQTDKFHWPDHHHHHHHHHHHKDEEEEDDDDDGDDGGDNDPSYHHRPHKLHKATNSSSSIGPIRCSSDIDLEGLLEAAIAKQQRFFKELLEGIEKKEVMREQIRQEREDKWRAEERAQRVVFTQAMQILSQTLGLGVQWPLTTVLTEVTPTRVHTSNTVTCTPGPNPSITPNRGSELTLAPTPDSDPTLFASPKRRSKNWKRAEVLQLIKLRGEMEERFSKSARRAALWSELAGTLATLGINRDGKQCREKWDKLMSEYKDVIDGKKDTSDSPYFVELQGALVGGRPREAG